MSELKIKDNKYISSILFPLTFIFPMLFSMGVCSGIGTLRAAVSAVILSLFMEKFESKSFMPSLFNFLIIAFLFNIYGSIAPTIALAVAGIVLCFGYKTDKFSKKFGESSIISGIMLATAISTTVLQTTNYFGIGANGNTVREMISSYVSLGFHGNWRGVLYGTIVLVIMITFPRKFKTLTKTVSPMIIALIITVVLNFWLNPSDMITSINEAGKFAYNYQSNISLIGFIASVLLGLVIGLSEIYSVSQEECSKKDFVTAGIVNIFLSPFICFVPKKIGNTIIKNIPGAIILAALIFIFKDVLMRVPVHSCAVIIIVTAWENVKWRNVKKAFTSPTELVSFLIPLALMLLI